MLKLVDGCCYSSSEEEEEEEERKKWANQRVYKS